MSISACIPCFNGSATLERALNALCGQTLPVAEIVVVDDASTDHSAKLARAAGARVIRHETNLGRGAGRARAVMEARGELVLFCDAGLELARNFAEVGLEVLNRTGAAAVFGRVWSDGQSAAHRWRARHLFKTERLSEARQDAPLATGAALVSRKAILEAGNFRGDLRAGEDKELGERLINRGYSVLFEPKLEARAIACDGLVSALSRYARWHASRGQISWGEYLRLINYSIKVMAREDLRHGDVVCAAASLACPHYQFWARRHDA